ncbi:uncharacterized protein LOC111058395 isoform X1 [Nilaparvata lugens]|uniref:uncharacterized protein LOC111058395 isoform X2 n=2 Tax=Nilaparvata lugens TaxID=108931 RepID=UPI000B98F682|nr:uncharacterized protein LOC111058395 isoform X2 [Nilaparvata lugens]XP_039296222.1 uncharacterized protein LOC111058395 isoform X1 [Nilaparvata lugens]
MLPQGVVVLLGFLINVQSSYAANRSMSTGSHSIMGDFHDLTDLIPYDKLIPLYINYAVEDEQTRKVLRYLRSDCFKANLKSLQKKKEFNDTAELLEPLGLSLHSTISKLHRQLDRYQQLSSAFPQRTGGMRHNTEISHDGVLGLVELTVEILPVQEIKELYKEKLDNFQFRTIVEQRGLLKNKLYKLVSLEECEFISNQLIGMGVPLKDVVTFLEEELTNFFDLEYVSDRESSEDYEAY